MTSERRSNNWRTWTIAITGMGARADNPAPGLAVARCLRQHPEFRGRLIALSYDALDAGLYDDHAGDEAYLLPYPSLGEAALLERLHEIRSKVALDAIVPCLDAELDNLQRLQPALAELGIASLLPDRKTLTTRSKENLPALGAATGVATPATRIVNDMGFFDTCHQMGWSYPLVIKGRVYGAHVVRNANEAKTACWRIAQQWGYPILVQRFIPGHEVNLTAVCDGESTLLGAVMMRKRGTTDQGKAWSGITIADQELLEMAETLTRHLSWRGPLEVEALRGEDGKLYLVELNPRFPSWIYLSHAVGRNLPAVLMHLLAREQCPALPAAKTGTLFIRHAWDLAVDFERWAAMATTGNHASPPA
ncbi:MAG: ATP-grasp domain-containing protein [Magnetococcales bacterium]|nr:ATP-grasp domain-containing protein [Magnetococcales bacterium]